MAQLVEWSLLIPEVRGSNPDISKIYIEHLLSTKSKRTKEKESENGPFKKSLNQLMCVSNNSIFK